MVATPDNKKILAEILTNALAYAQKKGWTSLEASINGGISFLASQYIQKGQNTLYLQKFDVEATNGIYSHQYMQNILAAQSEGTTLRNTYINTNSMSSAHTFVIPVYENMPETICEEPIDGEIVTQNIKVKGTKISIRSGASITAEKTSRATCCFVAITEIKIKIAMKHEKILYQSEIFSCLRKPIKHIQLIKQ